MPRWTPVPVAGGSYIDDCKPWSSQDTVNWIPVNPEQEGTRSEGLLRCLPGCTTFSVTGSGAPVRGVHNAEGKLFVVSGTTLYQIAPTGLPTSKGTIPGVGLVSMTHNQITNGNELVIGNGISGYVYNTVTAALTQITDAEFVGFKVCDFVDGYIAGVEPQGRFWYLSDLSGATVYNSLDRQEAETQPDKIVTLIVSHREVFVLGERTGQFFRNTGQATSTFENVNGTEMEVGCAGTFAVARLDNAVFWVGHDGVGYRLNGYQPVRITTHAIEQAWSRCDLSRAFCTVFEDRGHKVWYVTCPDGKTWGYDVSSGKWHRRLSNSLDRWRMNTLTLWNRRWIAGDYSNGKLYELDWAVQAENGEEMERRRTFPVAHDDQNKLTFNAIDLLFDTGLDSQSNPVPAPLITPLAISGDLANNYTDAVVNYPYAVVGGVLPRGNVTVTSGVLPTGLSMSVTGVVTGTLTTAGTFTWTVSVTDANGTPASVADTAVISTGYVFAIYSGNMIRGNTPLSWPDTSAPGNSPNLIESRNSRLFAFVTAGTGKVSTDGGATWTSCTGLPANLPLAIVYANSTWIVVYDDPGTSLYVSTDGVTFSSRSHGGAGIASAAIAINNIVIVGQAGGVNARRSVDGGVTWASTPLTTGLYIRAFAYSGTAIVAVSDDGNTYRSTNNGVSWTTIASGIVPASIAYGGGRFVIVSTTGTTRLSTDDGLTYANGGALSANMGAIGPSNELTYTHGLFVAAHSGGIATSTDAAVWTNRYTANPTSSLAPLRNGQ